MKINRKKKFGFVCLTLILIMTLSLTVFADMLFIEAESGKIDGLSVVNNTGAFSGKAIQSTEAEQTVEYTFNIDKAGKYLIWARVYCTFAEDNSYFYSLDGDTYNGSDLWIFDYYEDSDYEIKPDQKYIRPEYNDPALYSTWYWIPMSYRDTGGDPVTRHNVRIFDMTAGSHKLLLQTREIGAMIDKFIITDDLDYDPSKITGDPEAVYLAAIAAEAAAKAAAEAAAAAPVVVEAVPAPAPAPVAAVSTSATPPATSDTAFTYILIFMLSSVVFSATITILRRGKNRM